MIKRLFGAESTIGRIKSRMDISTQTQREIAHRVANATTPGANTFQNALTQADAQAAVDLERDMVELADTHLRFEAAANLLRKSYDQLRISFRSQS